MKRLNVRENRIALIPARLESERLPNKLLLPLGGLPIVVRTYRAVLDSGLFDQVVVVCNHTNLATELERYGCDYILNETPFESGTDRIANVLSLFGHEYIINVQADEPFVSSIQLNKLIQIFDNKQVEISTLKHRLNNTADIDNPNFVKIVCNANGRALYFSRSPIPFVRDADVLIAHFKHIGLYGYRRDVLSKLSKLAPSNLELAEKLENIRMIENGFYVGVAEVAAATLSIDTKEDYEKALQMFTE